MKFSIEDDDGTRVEVTEQQYKIIQKLNSRANGLDKQLGYLCEEFRKLQETEPGKYCCCGDCPTN